MKKLLLLLLLFAANSHAADFSPTPMTLTVKPQIEYKFDGSLLEIPFTLTGKSGAIWLVINTHGQAENIVGIRNGYLGWHYVNKIDTTIYISDRFERDPGENTLIWDGKDENGSIPEPGTYDYYLWGYDDKFPRQLACNCVRAGFNTLPQYTRMYEKDENGMPLPKPLLMGNQNPTFSTDGSGAWRPLDKGYNRHGTHFKWTLGNNPEDESLIQTTFCKIYYPQKDDLSVNGPDPDWISYGGAIFDPHDYNIFYHTSKKMIPYEAEGPDGKTSTYYKPYDTLFKWEFVPGGDAVLDYDWFNWDKGMWEEKGMGYNNIALCYTDNNYIYISTPINEYYGPAFESNYLKCINYNGEMIFDKLMHDWYIPDGIGGPIPVNCSIGRITCRNPNYFFLMGPRCCLHQLINTSRLVENSDDETDMVVFENRNGDYFMDNGWQANLEYPWICVEGVKYEYVWKEMRRYSINIDSNDFNLIYVGNYGIASFGVSTQDGTGIGYMSFGDEVGDSGVGRNAGGLICDNGSNYDGLYMGDRGTANSYWEDKDGTFYVAFDSAHGLITNNPAVQEKNPLQFKVSQNTPNPFNPSTTISFSIPEKSNVSVDIYNITGQKIKTLVDGIMSAGEHSVKWDAGECSAGVYFYKVKAGKFERTMRMMLVK